MRRIILWIGGDRLVEEVYGGIVLLCIQSLHAVFEKVGSLTAGESDRQH